MKRIAILVVEDEPEVRAAILRDLEVFEDAFRMEAAEDIVDARGVLAELEATGDVLGLILCDHVMPGTSGVEFLVELKGNAHYAGTRNVLITGQAGQEDTIEAVNRAQLNYYIAKPWVREVLVRVVREQLTEFVLRRGEDVLRYVAILDGARLMQAVKQSGVDS